MWIILKKLIKMDNSSLFTSDEVNFLIRLLIAHLLADFVFQTKKMVNNKRWLSKEMWIHIGIVFLMTFLFSGNVLISGVIMVLHYLTDGSKITLNNIVKLKAMPLYIADQAVHLVTLVLVWAVYYNKIGETFETIIYPFLNYQTSIIIVGYLLVTTPLGYLIGHATKKIQYGSEKTEIKNDQNGLWIGIFERIIILTFVLLSQYEAIGFLITGKSIIRYSAKNEDIKSEYVLLGTMMSYGVTILLGILLQIILAGSTM